MPLRQPRYSKEEFARQRQLGFVILPFAGKSLNKALLNV